MTGLTTAIGQAQKELFDRSVPGKAKAAADLHLPHGPGRAWLPVYVQTVRGLISVGCWLMLIVSVAVGFFHVRPRSLVYSPDVLFFSLFIGGVLAAGLLLAMSFSMSALGSLIGTRKIGSAQDPIYLANVRTLERRVLALMIANWLGAAFVEFLALSNYLRDQWHRSTGQYAIALIGGCLIAGLYVWGFRWAWYKAAYDVAAQESIRDYQVEVYARRKNSTDAGDALLQEADRSLGAVAGLAGTISMRRGKLSRDLDDFDGRIDDQKHRLRSVDTEFLAEEKKELERIDAEIRILTRKSQAGVYLS